MNKKAQFGLDTLLGYILFAVFLMFTIITLSISGCGRDKVSAGIETDSGGVLELRASEQLSAYLRTPLPDLETLKNKISEVKEKNNLGNFNKDKAIEFLEKHPDVYLDKTYGGFITTLYVYRDDSKAQDVFDAVTKALFYRHTYPRNVREINEGRLDDLYFTPIIRVKYGEKGNFFYDQGDLISGNSLTLPVSKKLPNVFKILPTMDKEGLSVRLESYAEEESLPTP